MKLADSDMLRGHEWDVCLGGALLAVAVYIFIRFHLHSFNMTEGASHDGLWVQESLAKLRFVIILFWRCMRLGQIQGGRVSYNITSCHHVQHDAASSGISYQQYLYSLLVLICIYMCIYNQDGVGQGSVLTQGATSP